MASGKRKPRWDIFEAAILLDGYLEVLQKEQPKTQIVRRVSTELREMAVNRGIEIDEIYRNENGISYQIQSMESAYKGQKVYVPATSLFEEVIEIYRNDNDSLYLPGGSFPVRVTLRERRDIRAGDKFYILEGSETVGFGCVFEMLS